MSETTQNRRNLRIILIVLAVIVGACFLLLGVLTLLGPALSPILSTGGGSLTDGGECARAVSAFRVPGGGTDSLGSFRLSVPGLAITAQNAQEIIELERFEQSQSRLNEALSVDSGGIVHVYRLPDWPRSVQVANHDTSRLVIVEGYPSYSSIVRVCDMAASKQLAAFSSDETTNAVAFTPDGKRFLVNEGRGTVAIYETGTPRRVARWDVRQGQRWRSTSQLTISPDGRLAAFGVTDQLDNSVKVSISLWSIDTNSQIAVVEAHSDLLISLIFSPDGTRLVSYGMDGAIRVWGIPEAQN